MPARRTLALAAAFAATACAASPAPQTQPSPTAATQGAPPARAIRRDIPMTSTIRRAFAAGTRDSSGRPGRRYWQLSTDYRIDARLDPATSVVSGRETVSFRNASDTSMRFIVMRLDQNIFAPNVARLEPVSEITEGMRVTKLTLNGTAVTLAAEGQSSRVAPTVPTAFGLGETVARIFTPTPIAKGATVTLEVEWSFKVPNVPSGRGMRMGRLADTLYQVAQWYPRVAVFDDLRGWDNDPYLGPSEFYNNFGKFDVRIDVPAGWLVGATGVLQNAAEVLTPTARERLSHATESDSVRTIVGATEGGPGKATAAGSRLVWHFTADSVADFAWMTAKQLVWEATSATIPGRGRVPVYQLFLPGHAANYAQAAPLARHALEFYSRLWMPYAFPQLTLVDGPELGMEYPMFIMSAAGASDHETGHQWWPMMVGVNETWYGFMDEGFNQYMNILSAADRRRQPPPLDGVGQAYGQVSGSELEAPLMWDANYGGPMYGFQAYGKAPQMLSMLGGIVGDSAVWRAMSEYAKTWRFKHPSPWDYAFSMNRALGQDLSWFWYYWLFTTDAVDGSIQNVTTTGTRAQVVVRQDGQMPSPVVLAVQLAATGPAIHLPPGGRQIDDRNVEVTYPVDVWFAGARTFTADLDFGRTIEKITLDPHRRFPDHDATDNVWPRSSTAAGGQR